MDHGTPAGVLEPTGGDPVVDDERQRVLEDLTREISEFEAEYARAPGSDLRH